MRNTKDLTGSKIGKLMILDRKIENNNIFYYCKCDCGNKKWIRSENLTKKQPTLSCTYILMQLPFLFLFILSCVSTLLYEVIFLLPEEIH